MSRQAASARPTNATFRSYAAQPPLLRHRSGLFSICGYQFSPRIAGLADTRLWRTNTRAVYGPLEHMSRHTVRLDKIRAHWGDMLRVAGSLTMGTVRAYNLIRPTAAPPAWARHSPATAGSPRRCSAPRGAVLFGRR
ncbi:Tn3 family transposase [Nonomuraea sp. GTA35]|uniref:Tn3 family transposase n=1 Tax=Nonomuraea sp. GTA35 TaxID=1676746 RepID=UPI0035C22156